VVCFVFLKRSDDLVQAWYYCWVRLYNVSLLSSILMDDRASDIFLKKKRVIGRGGGHMDLPHLGHL
jgi:hypothetical protein